MKRQLERPVPKQRTVRGHSHAKLLMFADDSFDVKDGFDSQEHPSMEAALNCHFHATQMFNNNKTVFL